MNANIGDISLAAAIFGCGATVVLSMAAARFGTPSIYRATRWGFAFFTAMLLVASWALVRALNGSDFSITYVASYTERALPLGYKLSAFWAGQEGSLLFWGVVLALMAGLFVWTKRKDTSRQNAWTMFTLAAVCGFFCAMLLLAANPFKTSPHIPEDGRGLNPMLQNIGMIAHPPTLFIGYAGYTIPFALMMGALITRRLTDEWITAARRWALASWVFLTVGIVLGAQWAYVELGWGGYWAWDPVENASLLPWLTGTALLHSVFVQQQRGMFKLWNVGLAASTFLLCIFGTYLTRSGVIQSVHSFGASLIGTFFLIFMIVCSLTCVIAMLANISRFKGERSFEAFVSKEGSVLIGNTMLVLMMLLTVVGTVFPIISNVFAGNSVTLTQSFYNKTVLPLAIVMLTMMAFAPMLNYGPAKFREVARRMRIPLILAHVAMLSMIALVGRSLWTSFVTFAITLTAAGIIFDFINVAWGRAKAGEGNLLLCIIRAIDANHRRYGGHLAHLGMAMIVAGVAGSSLYATKESLQLTENQSAKVGSYEVTLQKMEGVTGKNYTAGQATVKIVDSGGEVSVVKPQIRQYNKSEQNNAEVAFITGLKEDVYVTLLGFENNDAAAIQVVINPLVLWIWIGGTAMTLGGLWSILPSFTRVGSPSVTSNEGKKQVAEVLS